jgi:hypothetical protein
MDPMSVLLSALAVVQPLGDQVMADAYAGLKALIVRKFGGQEPALEDTLDQYASRPDDARGAASQQLKQVGAELDQEVVDAATDLLRQAEAARPGVTGGLVGQINAQGGKVVVVGDRVETINM